MNVTKASACIAVRSLQNSGMVYRDERRRVFLTAMGEYQAVLLLGKLAIIRHFLISVLGIYAEDAHTDACAIEHVISPGTLCALCRFNNLNSANPQGKENCPVQLQDLSRQ
ncbi:MAG: metal-dependent transcriptional regulator [Oscillospiraceae bacterium]